MTASPAPKDRAGPVDRLVDYVLDVDGDIYGDERERIRWYEGISLAATFQWLAVPSTMAVLVWFADRSTVPFLVAVLVVFLLPILVIQGYVWRKGVRLRPARTGVKYWLIGVLGSVPYLVFTLGALAAYDVGPIGDGNWWRALVGTVVGGLLGLLTVSRLERYRRRREDAAGD